MIKSAKLGILRLINRFGYRVLKVHDYENLLAKSVQPPQAPDTVAPPGVVTPAAAPVVPAEPIEATAPSSPDASSPQSFVHPATIPAPFDEAPFSLLLQRLPERPNFSMARLHALYLATKYITESKIEGDLVDCGWGDTTTLLALASCLLSLKNYERQLVLFDSTADPLHRAETDLEPWGAEYDLLGNPPGRKPPLPEPVPAELLSSGYPRERISIRRYPREPIAQTAPVAFLNITSETYDANRKALNIFFSRLSRTGMVAVEDVTPTRGDGYDTIAKFLRATGHTLWFTQVAPNFWMAIKP
jgi:hypothetical protein